MAVFERRPRPWTGPITPPRRRFLVVARYARREVFRSRITTALFALALVPCVAAVFYIYLRYNLPALAELEIALDQLVPVDERFFYYGLHCQAFFAFLLTVLIGPGLVSPDLANNALPLYLARPLSRPQYVLGKVAVLVAVLSAVTWLPLLALALLEASLAEGAWLIEHVRVPLAVVVGSALWIAVLSLLAVTLSAWVRWKTLAAALVVAVFFVSRALATVVNQTFDTAWSDLVSPVDLVHAIWEWLFFGTTRDTAPVAAAWVGLAAFAGLCLLALDRKLRAYEVVR